MGGHKYPLHCFVKSGKGTVHCYLGYRDGYSPARDLSEVLTHFPGAEKRDLKEHPPGMITTESLIDVMVTRELREMGAVR